MRDLGELLSYRGLSMSELDVMIDAYKEKGMMKLVVDNARLRMTLQKILSQAYEARAMEYVKNGTDLLAAKAAESTIKACSEIIIRLCREQLCENVSLSTKE